MKNFYDPEVSIKKSDLAEYADVSSRTFARYLETRRGELAEMDHKCFGKWFAKNVVEETVDLDGLSEHMSNHNSPYSKGVIKGLLTDMISCIKELLLEGKNVKVDDLAIFSLGIKNKAMADKEEDFSLSKNVEGVKLKARATGELMSKSLNLDATLKKATYVNGKLTESGNGSSSAGSGSGAGSSNGGNAGGGDNPGGDDDNVSFD